MIKIIDFYAKWCKPCKTYDAILPEIAQEHGFEIEKVDVEEHAEEMKEFDIQGLPTLLIVNNDQPKGVIVGAYGKARLIQKLGEILGYSLEDNKDVSMMHPVEKEYIQPT